MSIQFLWAALSAACVTATPPVYDDEITNAIAMIANCDIRNALLNQTAWGVHGYGPKFAVHLLDTLLEE